MTLMSLLNHVGVHAPRGVTVDGRVLVGRAAIAAVIDRRATAIAPHTFHGGDDPQQDSHPDAWWDDPAVRAADIAAVRSAFPAFVLDETVGYVWRGQINSGRGVFEIAVTGSPGNGLPQIVPVSPRILGRNEGSRGFRKAEHLYTSGSLCVADATDWNPAEHTTATAIAWAAHWYAAYTSWRITGGSWPTEGYQSNAA